MPPPKGDPAAPLKALVFDSWYDSYRGVVMLVRVLEGTLELKQQIRLMSNSKKFEVQELGVFAPFSRPVPRLIAGEVGVAGGQRQGDPRRQGRRHRHRGGAPHRRAPFPGFKEVKPMVFCGVFPIDSADYENLRDALEKLQLNDAAFTYEPETSTALGFGFRCGFLGLLHMEIVQERLEREYNLDLITTAPSVVYKVFTDEGRGAADRQPGQAARRRSTSSTSRSRSSPATSTCPTSTWARSSSSARTGAGCRRTSSTWAAPASASR